MRPEVPAKILILALAAAALSARPAPPTVEATQPAEKTHFAVTNTFNLGGDGPWNSITVDPEGKTLFIPRTRRTIVVDAATGKQTAEIGPANGACAVALAPPEGRGFISNSKEGTVTVFDLKTYAVLGKITVADDPGAIVYDPRSRKMLVCCASGKLVPFSADIDLKTAKPDPAIELAARGDSMVADGMGMLYVTVKEKDQVAVVDTREMRLAVTWPLASWLRPAGISMDRVHSRLFVACRSRILVLSASDGHMIDDLTTGQGSDATEFFDGHAFTTTAEGWFEVLGQNAAGKFEVQQKLDLALILRTTTANPRTGAIYIPAAEMNGKKGVAGTFRILVLEKK